jgi:SAM-dependent methyltransferase
MSTKARGSEWFDDEAFWKDTFPFLFTEERFTNALADVDRAIQLAKPEGMTALDLCCGPGRCSLALAQRGYTVTGVDCTTFLLDEAWRRAQAAHLSIEWVREDMRDFVRAGAFDFIINMYTSFGYFADRREDTQVLKNVFASLRPGGAFVMELLGKEILAKIFLESSAKTQPDGTLFIEQRRVVDDWTRCINDWTWFRDGAVRRSSFTLNLYSGAELRRDLEETGFTVELFGSLAGELYGPGATRLVVVAKKPRSFT